MRQREGGTKDEDGEKKRKRMGQTVFGVDDSDTEAT